MLKQTKLRIFLFLWSFKVKRNTVKYLAVDNWEEHRPKYLIGRVNSLVL